MKRTIKFVSIVTMAVALTQSVQAVSITGAMAFAGQVTYDNSSPGNATQVTSWTSTYVSSDSGTFAAPSPFAVKTGPSSAVTFTHAAWSFNTSSPISDFWSVGGFTFQLLSSFVVSQGGTPGVNGFVVPPANAEALAATLERFLADRSLAASMAREAGFRSGRLSWARYEADVQALYDTVLGARRSACCPSQ